MDNVRLLLFIALAFLGMMLWQAWQQDYGSQAPANVEQSGRDANTEQGVPQVPAVTDIDKAPGSATPITPETMGDVAVGNRPIRVQTDTLDLTIDTLGGTISQAYLRGYPVSVDEQDKKYRLLNTSMEDYFVAQSGLLAAPTLSAPNHKAVYSADKETYELADGEQTLVVDLTWTSPDNLQVIKRYTLTRGSHQVSLQHIVKNGTGKPWNGREYRQFQRAEPSSDGQNALMYTYTGGAVYSEADKYQKYSFEDLSEGKLNRDADGGWFAMIQHYFLAAFIPPAAETQHFYGKSLGDNRYIIGSYTPAAQVAPDGEATFSGSLWLGPKLQGPLADIAKGLDLTVDYGWLAFIAQPMYWILDWINNLVNNWGWTIIIFTILIKLVFYKLSETSYRSMANMRKLTPRIQALKDRYGDDKQRMQQAMMEIYSKEKINPLGGCLPMLVQIPFFIALYWVLLESVELRQASWILWFNDLSEKDPYFVLPLLMGATMVLQQKLNPPPPDPMQAKLMMMLPVVFTAMFAFFPSGLVLYWFFNNLLSIVQQWMITKRIEQGEKA